MVCLTVCLSLRLSVSLFAFSLSQNFRVDSDVPQCFIQAQPVTTTARSLDVMSDAMSGTSGNSVRREGLSHWGPVGVRVNRPGRSGNPYSVSCRELVARRSGLEFNELQRAGRAGAATPTHATRQSGGPLLRPFGQNYFAVVRCDERSTSSPDGPVRVTSRTTFLEMLRRCTCNHCKIRRLEIELGVAGARTFSQLFQAPISWPEPIDVEPMVQVRLPALFMRQKCERMLVSLYRTLDDEEMEPTTTLVIQALLRTIRIDEASDLDANCRILSQLGFLCRLTRPGNGVALDLVEAATTAMPSEFLRDELETTAVLPPRCLTAVQPVLSADTLPQEGWGWVDDSADEDMQETIALGLARSDTEDELGPDSDESDEWEDAASPAEPGDAQTPLDPQPVEEEVTLVEAQAPLGSQPVEEEAVFAEAQAPLGSQLATSFAEALGTPVDEIDLDATGAGATSSATSSTGARANITVPSVVMVPRVPQDVLFREPRSKRMRIDVQFNPYLESCDICMQLDFFCSCESNRNGRLQQNDDGSFSRV